jgi:O-antigen/teichoic acid export membrane protein
MIDLGAAGIYTTMIFLTSIILIPYRSLVKVAAPLIALFWKNRDMKQMQEIYTKAASANLVVGATLFMLIWVNLDSVFYFMPGEYEAGRYAFLLLGIGKLFDMSAGLNNVILYTSKKYRYDLVFMLSLLVFAFVSNLIFIPLWGIEGAAFASMLSLILFNLMRIAFLKYQFHIQPFAHKQIWVPVILTAICIISEYVEPLSTVLTDIIIRSAISLAFLLVPLYYLNVSPELNQWTLQQIKKISAFFGK